MFDRVEDEPALFPRLEQRAALVQVPLVGAVLGHVRRELVVELELLRRLVVV